MGIVLVSGGNDWRKNQIFPRSSDMESNKIRKFFLSEIHLKV